MTNPFPRDTQKISKRLTRQYSNSPFPWVNWKWEAHELMRLHPCFGCLLWVPSGIQALRLASRVAYVILSELEGGIHLWAQEKSVWSKDRSREEQMPWQPHQHVQRVLPQTSGELVSTFRWDWSVHSSEFVAHWGGTDFESDLQISLKAEVLSFRTSSEFIGAPKEGLCDFSTTRKACEL